MKKVLLGAIIFAATITAEAGTFAFTWQNTHNNHYFGCGPLQCLQASEATEQEALRMVKGAGNTISGYVGEVGRCSVYRIGGDQSGRSDSRLKELLSSYCF